MKELNTYTALGVFMTSAFLLSKENEGLTQWLYTAIRGQIKYTWRVFLRPDFVTGHKNPIHILTPNDELIEDLDSLLADIKQMIAQEEVPQW